MDPEVATTDESIDGIQNMITYSCARVGDKAKCLLEIIACPHLKPEVREMAWGMWQTYANPQNGTLESLAELEELYNVYFEEYHTAMLVARAFTDKLEFILKNTQPRVSAKPPARKLAQAIRL